MKHSKILIPFLLMLFACNNSADDNLKPVLQTSTQIYQADSVSCAFIYENNERLLTWTVNDKRSHWDFVQRIGNEQTQLIPEYISRSKDFLRLQTFSSGPFSKSLFVSLVDSLSPVYVPNDVEYFDTLNAKIYIIDEVGESDITWSVMNLYTSVSNSIKIPLDSNCNSYPWYDSLSIFKDSIIIHTCSEGKSEYVLK